MRAARYEVEAEPSGEHGGGDIAATYWKLRVGASWTMPAVEISSGAASSTALLVAEDGRSSEGAIAETRRLLAAGARVIAIDPFYFGESKISQRAYLFALRKSVIGGGEDAYEEAFKITAEEFDQQFDKYLKDRFKPFRDKERPADYGRGLGPNPEKTPYRGVYTAEPSPSGDLIAIFTGNRRDGEGDIILVSRKDGSVVRKLTAGFDKDKGFEYISTPGGRWVTVPWLSWSATCPSRTAPSTPTSSPCGRRACPRRSSSTSMPATASRPGTSTTTRR